MSTSPKLPDEVFDSTAWQRWAAPLCALFLLFLALATTAPVLKDSRAVFAFNDGNIETVLSPIYQYPSSLLRIWDNQFFFGRGESFGVAITEWSLLETLLGPHQYRRIGVLLALWLTGLAGFWTCRQFGRSRGAALFGGSLLLLCGWTATFPAAGLLGRAFSLAWAALSLGFLERSRRSTLRGQGGWWAIVLAGACLGFSVENTPDVGAFFAVSCAVFLLTTRLPRSLLPWHPRPWFQLAAILVLYVASSFAAAWPTVVKMKASQLLGADAAAVAPGGERYDWATQWSLPKAETWSLVAGNFHGTTSRNPSGPYWGAMGQSADWRQNRRGYANFKLVGYSVGGTCLVLLLFLWMRLPRRRWQDPELNVPGQRRMALVTSVLALLSLGLAWGRFFPLYRLVFLMPALTAIRNPEKWLGPFTLFLALAVSLAVDVVRSAATRPPAEARGVRWLWIFGWGLAATAFLIVELYDTEAIGRALTALNLPSGLEEARSLAQGSTLVLILISLTIAIGVQGLIQARGLTGTNRGRGITLVLLSCLSVELFWAAQPYMRQHHYDHVLQPNPLTEALDEATQQGRIKLLPARHPILNRWRLTYLISQGYDLFDPVSVSRLPEGDRELFEVFDRHEIDLWRWGGVRYFLCTREAANQLIALSAPGQRFVVRASRPAHQWAPNPGEKILPSQQEEISLVEFLDAQPVYRWAEKWETVPDNPQAEAQALQSLVARAATGTVTVHESSPPQQGRPPVNSGMLSNPASTDVVTTEAVAIENGNADGSALRLLSQTPTSAQIEVEVDRPSLLVRATRFHPGWKVELDGEAAEVLRVDHSFQGVRIPPGRHQLHWTFDQPRFVFAGGIANRLLMLVGLFFFARHRRFQPSLQEGAGGGGGKGEKRTSPSTVLVMALSGAGDVLLSTPMLRELRRLLPHARIEVLVMQGPAARDVLAGNPNVDRVILHNFMAAGKGDSLRLLWRLRRSRFDLVLVPMPHNRLVYSAMAAAIGGHWRLGFHYQLRCGSMERWFLHRTLEEHKDLHISENNLRLLAEGLGLPARVAPEKPEIFLSEKQKQTARFALEALGIAPQEVIIGGHPGSGGTKNLAEKRWPEEQWIRLAQGMAKREGCHLLLFGGPEEEALRERIAAAAQGGVSQVIAMPTTPVPETAALIAELDVLVSCDTLLTHVGVATDTPSVVLFGPTPIDPVRPVSVPYEVITLGLSCSPCYGYGRHGIRCTNPKRLQCMAELSGEDVLAALDRMLAGEDPSRRPPWRAE
ncbi:MAG: hypothetical protein K0U98_23750 [Deltaproteobacteria bacterium]|nr:hypothetical protein [Deltaproteobacteria bacterium]